MIIVFSLMALAGIVGFLLSMYLFFYRLRLKQIWRWVGGIAGGLLLGGFMALIALLIFWPPVVDFVTVGGLALIVFTIMVIMDTPKASVGAEQPETTFNYSTLLSGSEPTADNSEI